MVRLLTKRRPLARERTVSACRRGQRLLRNGLQWSTGLASYATPFLQRFVSFAFQSTDAEEVMPFFKRYSEKYLGGELKWRVFFFNIALMLVVVSSLFCFTQCGMYTCALILLDFYVESYDMCACRRHPAFCTGEVVRQ